MTTRPVLRGAVVALLMLAVTVVLVGFCGVGGLLLWLGMVSVAACFPNRCVDVAMNFQPRAALRWTVDAWRWLDRR